MDEVTIRILRRHVRRKNGHFDVWLTGRLPEVLMSRRLYVGHLARAVERGNDSGADSRRCVSRQVISLSRAAVISSSSHHSSPRARTARALSGAPRGAVGGASARRATSAACQRTIGVPSACQSVRRRHRRRGMPPVRSAREELEQSC